MRFVPSVGQRSDRMSAGSVSEPRIETHEHRAMSAAIAKALRTRRSNKYLFQLYGVAFHDVYHAGQIRLLRRLQER